MKITIQFDLRLYSRFCLEQAIIAYSNFIENVIVMDEAIYKVTISSKSESEEDLMCLAGEFNNYVLQLESRMGA